MRIQLLALTLLLGEYSNGEDGNPQIVNENLCAVYIFYLCFIIGRLSGQQWQIIFFSLANFVVFYGNLQKSFVK